MFPLPIATYVKMGLCILLLGGAWYFGYSFEHSRFVKFQDEIRATAEKQIAQNQAKAQKQELINKGIANEYQAKLSALKSYYGGLRQPGSGSMPSLSNPASGVNESATDQQLACAYTTQQLVSLQEWINQQLAIK